MMVVTTVGGAVAAENEQVLQDTYAAEAAELPPAIVETNLMRSVTEPGVWQILTVWRSREELDEMRRGTETPVAIKVFRSANADPKLTVFEVVTHLGG